MSFIHPDAQIGTNTLIGEHVYIGPRVRVGNDCIIKTGAVIGHDGFGYERDTTGRWAPKDHNSGVLIEDDVHIGAHSCIDRGSWINTRLEQGVRIDNLVHIAHNVRVRRNAVVVAHAMLAGSVVIGEGAWIGPSSCIRQRLVIGRGALVGMGSVVVKDVPANVTVAGNPARVIDATQGVRDEM